MFIWSFSNFGIFLILITIISRAILFSNVIYVALPTVIYILAKIILFDFPFREGIILTLSSASFLYDYKIHIFDPKKTNLLHSFYKLSCNLVNWRQEEAINRRKGINEEMNNGEYECSICKCEKVSMIWMPCGHMSICQHCSDILLQQNYDKCTICKEQYSKIHHISKI